MPVDTPQTMTEELKASAVGFGFDISWIGDLIGKWGNDVLGLVVEAVRSGFNRELVVDILEKFGPLVLELLVNMFNKKKMHMTAAAAGGPVVVADEISVFDASIIETLVQRYLPQLIERYLPMLLEQYGDRIVQWVVDWILNNMRRPVNG